MHICVSCVCLCVCVYVHARSVVCVCLCECVFVLVGLFFVHDVYLVWKGSGVLTAAFLVRLSIREHLVSQRCSGPFSPLLALCDVTKDNQ
jgi:hypothetical protein